MNYSKEAGQAPQPVLDRREAAAYLKISLGKLDQLDISKAYIGRRVVYRRADIDAWLERQTAKGGSVCA